MVTVVARQYEITLRHESLWFWLIPVLGLLLLLIQYFRVGRDPSGRGTIAPEFAPPEGLLPAEMGALIDESADNTDITATIIDLAVRGYLKIREQNKKYTLIKLKEPSPSFKPYENSIYAAIFDAKKEVDLNKMYEGFSDLSTIKDTIYQALIKKQYFLKNPANVRNSYLFAGLIILFLCGGFYWLSWHLVFALGLTGLLLIVFSNFMPKKTREGVMAKEKSLGFKEFLYRAERYRLKWQEKEGIFEKYLPYAMIFGIAEIWAKNFAGFYKNPPSWYEGDFTSFNTIMLAHSLASFSTTASHSYSPPATSASSGSSGFGGGGSSGGGFGGGGGRSW